MKRLFAVILCAVCLTSASAQIQQSGYVATPSATTSILGQTQVAMTNATCNVVTPGSNCTVSGLGTSYLASYVQDYYLTGSLSSPQTVVIPLQPGGYHCVGNSTGQPITVGGVTGTTVLVENGQTQCIISHDGANYVVTSPASAGGSTHVIFLSTSGCAAQNSNPNLGAGTPDTACINSLLAPATAANPILLIQDGFSLIDGNGISGPRGGHWAISGLGGGGVNNVKITSCTLSGGVATFVTSANNLTIGQGVYLNSFTTCTSLNNTLATVSATGLSSTGFQVAASGSQTTVSENATAKSLFGPGFYLATGSTGDAISNGVTPSSGTCEVAAGVPPARGSDIELSNFVINGNVANNSQFCFNIDILDINTVNISNVISYDAPRYNLKFANVGWATVDRLQAITSAITAAATNGDGVHIDGPSNDIKITNSYFKTNDDSIALNAKEGYCGPITRVSIANSTFEQSENPFKAYNNNLATCGNGLVPLISTVDIVNFSGTTEFASFAVFGSGTSGLGSLNPAIDDFHWSNSTITLGGFAGAGAPPITFIDNVGTISFSDITIKNPSYTNGTLFDMNNAASGTGHIGSMSLTNVKVVDTPTGSTFTQLYNSTNSSSGFTTVIGSLYISGFGVVWQGGNFTNVACLLCNTTNNTITALQFGDNDYSHVAKMTTAAIAAAGTLGTILGPYVDDNAYGFSNLGIYFNEKATAAITNPARLTFQATSNVALLGFRQSNAPTNGFNLFDSTSDSSLLLMDAANAVSIAQFAKNNSTGNGEVTVNNCAPNVSTIAFCVNSATANKVTVDTSGNYIGPTEAIGTTSSAGQVAAFASGSASTTVPAVVINTPALGFGVASTATTSGIATNILCGSLVATAFCGQQIGFANSSGNAMSLLWTHTGTNTGYGNFQTFGGASPMQIQASAVILSSPTSVNAGGTPSAIGTSCAGGIAFCVNTGATFTVSTAGLAAAATGSTVNGSLICTAAGVAGCATGTVTSIATTGPITGGTITTTGTIACATCLTATAPANHGVVLGAASQALGVTAAGASNAVLIGQGSSADPIFSATPAINCTNCTNIPTGNSGMTATQVAIAGSATTITSSKALAGTGTGITTGPTTSVSGNLASFTGTAGQVADSGVAAASVGSPSFTNVATGTNTTAGMTVGTGASLGTSGSGTINATQLSGKGIITGSAGGSIPTVSTVSTNKIVKSLDGVATYNDSSITDNGTTVSTSEPISAGTGSTVNSSLICTAAGTVTGCPTLAVSNAITTATGGSGTGTVTCLTASCTNLRGTYSVAGGTFTTGNFLTLVWPTTTTAYACTATMNGGTGFLGIGNDVATATGMNISAGVTILGVTVTVNYSCRP